MDLKNLINSNVFPLQIVRCKMRERNYNWKYDKKKFEDWFKQFRAMYVKLLSW